MSPSSNLNGCERAELTCAYALQALPASEVPRPRPISPRARIASASWRASARWSIGSSPGPPMCCVRRRRCRRVLRFASPRRPASHRCCRRRGSGPSRNGNRSRPGSNASCSRPTRKGTGSACWYASRPARVTQAHTHAGVEELHLLDGELWIDERKLFPGDYNYGAPGAGDERVWSETGCTCVLVTSTKDVLR